MQYESALDLCKKALKEISRARREHKHSMTVDQGLALDNLVASREAVQREMVRFFVSDCIIVHG